jgi:class 3 adenylate cyclase
MRGRTLEQKAHWIYRIASLMATLEAFCLFILGLDLTFQQIIVFCLFGFPAPVAMYWIDCWLISRHVRPIQAAVEALDQGQPADPRMLAHAWFQALNLPTLTLLRVLIVHAPSVLLPLTGLCLLANWLAGLDLRWWQFIVLWLFWPITAAPHAIVEYFLIDRAIQPILTRLQPHVLQESLLALPSPTLRQVLAMALGQSLPEPRILRTTTGVQLAWLFLFVSLMPMFVLGTSSYFKTVALNSALVGNLLRQMAEMHADPSASSPAGDVHLFRFDAHGRVLGDTPPPELSFAALAPRLSRTSGWLENSPFLTSYARQSDGSLVVLALPSGATSQTGTLGRWILFLVMLNTVVSAAIIVLLSIRVHRLMSVLLGQMRRVQDGDLSGQWSPRTTDEFLDISNGFNRMLEGLRERQVIRDTFGRFVSPQIAEVVLSGRMPLLGERREVTMLFQDIRDFTGISEKMTPEALVGMLNQFFTEIVAAVEVEGGVVKQFLGDGVKALFGAPLAHADDPDRAVRAALAMVARLEALNMRLSSQRLPMLRIGVGIHTGEVIAGQIGPDTRVEYDVTGDAVNVASRIEGLTKEMHTTILISEATAARLGPGFTLGRAAELPVRGKEKPVKVVEVLG